MTIATYSLGPCTRPPITHDNGFLERNAPRAPVLKDHLHRTAWGTLLEFAEAAQRIPFMPHNDIPDALAAYRHFLEGRGQTRTFSYERYVANDPSGGRTLRSALFDVQLGAWDWYQRRFAGQDGVAFSISSSALAARSGSVSFPYPATYNWQKAIGAHQFWLCADVRVALAAGRPRFTLDVTLHAEDRYNFNPGQNDIATGLPDAMNGEFEITGLGQQYLNVATLRRRLAWTGAPDRAGVLAVPGPPGRQRQPSDNRRLRNRL